MSATIPYVDPVGRQRQYPQSFGLDDLQRLEELVLSRPHTTMGRVVGYSSEEQAVRTVVRHDVDHSLDHALRFARWEAERSISASYFILHTAWYYRDFLSTLRSCWELEALGHEVGVHHDTTTAAARYGCDGKGVLERVLRDMRSAGLTISGCAAHASDLSLDNLGVWNEWRLEDFGLDYEAYHVHREFCANYISDNKGELRRPLEHVDGKPTHLLVHPEHWNLGD